MKTILLIPLFALGVIFPSLAQFTTDPNNPTIVSNATLPQKDVQSVADGAGGIYVFWFDARTGVNLWDVYGQHYDANGTALWEANGREIINYDGPIRAFSFVRENNGEFLFAFAVNNNTDASQNGVYVRRTDANGQPLWEEDIKVFDPTSYPNSLATAFIVKSQNYYYVSTSGTLIGGSNTCRIIKIDANGNLLWPFNGSTIPGLIGFGSYGISSDQSGGLYVYASSGNGSGAILRCMRVIGVDNLSNAWPDWVNVTAGYNGLSYQYSAIGDAQGITLLWEGYGPEANGTNIYARRLLASNGLLDWNENTKIICAAPDNQSRFYWKKSGNEYCIVWSDSRSGILNNNAIYAQKLTTNGVLLWQENGVQVANLTANGTYPKFDLDANNNIYVTHRTNTGFVAHKVNSDGVVATEPSGILVLNNSFSPSGKDYEIVSSQNKFIAVGSNNNDIFLNRIHPNVVQVSQTVTACNEYTIYGETFNETGVYTIAYDPDTTLILTLTIIQNVAEFVVDGWTLTAVNDGEFQWYNCELEAPIQGATGPVYNVTQSGFYTLRLTNGDCEDFAECVEIIVTSIDEHSLAESITVYPNPSSHLLNIDMSMLQEQPQNIDLFTTSGQLVWQQKAGSSQLVSIPVNELAEGFYIVQISGNNFSIRKRWVKN